MKNRTIWNKLGEFVLGKGFYIVLFLCVATIGISGYYLINTMTQAPEDAEAVSGSQTLVLPDSEANGPDPAGSLSSGAEAEGTSQTAPPTSVPERTEQPDDPEPLKQTVQEDPPAAPAALVYTWPVRGEVLRDFSVETLALDPTLGDWRTHGGVDIAASAGTQVLAMAAGSVTEVYEDGLMGTTVVIDHGNGLFTTYCNLAAQPTVEPGEPVETGSVIGTVGSTAIAESGLAPHLHLEAVFHGVQTDPLEYLP